MLTWNYNTWRQHVDDNCKPTNSSNPFELVNKGAMSNSDSLVFSVPVTAIIGSLIAICIILTIFGNFIVLLAFIKVKNLRTFSDYLILNLAISDLIIGAICIPFYAPYVLTGRWSLGHGMCLFWLVIDYITPAASAINIFIISLDRYIQVAYPLWARNNQTTTLLVIFILIPWVIPTLYFVPAICLWEVTKGRVIPDGECFLPYNSNVTVLSIGACIEFLFPFVTVSTFNLLVYLSIRRRSKKFWPSIPNSRQISTPRPPPSSSETGPSRIVMDEQEMIVTTGKSDNNHQKIALQRDRKAARSLFIFVFMFAICWMPYEVLATTSTICGGDCINSVLFEFTFWILWLNSTINPILYPLLHSRYRIAFYKILSVKQNTVGPMIQSIHS